VGSQKRVLDILGAYNFGTFRAEAKVTVRRHKVCEVACLSCLGRRSMHPCLCILGASRRASRVFLLRVIALLARIAYGHSLIVALY